MGSWRLSEDEARDALVGKRIVGLEFYDTYIDLTVEGGRRVRLDAAQPAVPEPVVEVWQHEAFTGDEGG